MYPDLLALVEQAEREGKWIVCILGMTEWYTPAEVRSGKTPGIAARYILAEPERRERYLREQMEEARAALQLHQELLAGKNRFAEGEANES